MKITKIQLRRIIKEVHADYKGLPQSDIDYYELADDYGMWVKANGHATPAASSVMASYFLEKGLEGDHDKHDMLGKAFRVDHNDIMRDIKLQQSERSSLKESIRRMIRESMPDEPIRMIPGDSLDAEMMKQRRSKKTTSSDFRDTIVMSPAGDSVLVGGQETSPDNVEGALEALSGQMLGYGDVAKLESLLKKQMASGYVEIPISWSPNTGWKF